MVKERENPFRPGAGEVPPHRAGHEAAVRDLADLLELLVAGRSGDMVVMYGPRGNGKTALLGTLRQMAEEQGALAAKLDVGMMTGDPEELADVLEPMGRPRVPPVGGEEGGSVTPDATSLGRALRTLLEGPLVLMVDDAHEIPPRDGMALLQIAQRLIRDRLPLFVVLSGTPCVWESLRRARVGFMARARQLKIGRLESRDATREALSVPAERSGLPFAADALEFLAGESRGYPPFIQLLGKHAWDAAIGRGPNASRIGMGDAQAGARMADGQRETLCDDHLREAAAREVLPEAVAVSKAFAALDGDGTLSDAQLRGVVRPALSEGRTVRDAIDELSALGLIWEPRNLVWEQGVPSLCTYLAKNAHG